MPKISENLEKCRKNALNLKKTGKTQEKRRKRPRACPRQGPQKAPKKARNRCRIALETGTPEMSENAEKAPKSSESLNMVLRCVPNLF